METGITQPPNVISTQRICSHSSSSIGIERQPIPIKEFSQNQMRLSPSKRVRDLFIDFRNLYQKKQQKKERDGCLPSNVEEHNHGFATEQGRVWNGLPVVWVRNGYVANNCRCCQSYHWYVPQSNCWIWRILADDDILTLDRCSSCRLHNRGHKAEIEYNWWCKKLWKKKGKKRKEN